MRYPEALEALIEQFRRYPGVGAKTAERYALHTLTTFTPEDLERFKAVLSALESDIKPCPVCGFLTTKGQCQLCSNQDRDQRKILVVEDVKDVVVIEKTHTYQGLYHVLGGVIAPSSGIGPDQLNLKPLLERLKNDAHEEVILATNLNDAGEITAKYIERLLQPTNITVSRIAYGLPAGGSISYADEITLLKALEGRKAYQK